MRDPKTREIIRQHRDTVPLRSSLSLSLSLFAILLHYLYVETSAVKCQPKQRNGCSECSFHHSTLLSGVRRKLNGKLEEKRKNAVSTKVFNY